MGGCGMNEGVNLIYDFLDVFSGKRTFLIEPESGQGVDSVEMDGYPSKGASLPEVGVSGYVAVSGDV
jgi:hypothetical protein